MGQGDNRTYEEIFGKQKKIEKSIIQSKLRRLIKQCNGDLDFLEFLLKEHFKKLGKIKNSYGKSIK